MKSTIFWSHQFGIISPHRLQNIEIKKRLEARAKEADLEGVDAWSDTVEKMQGQSRDGVLISMTVSDIEFWHMQEGGFCLTNVDLMSLLRRQEVR